MAEITIKEVKDIYKSWLYLEDTDFIDIVLAVAISEKEAGEPLWLFIIAPPGSTKTEIVRSFSGDNFYTLDDLTSHTFISGLAFGKKDRTIRDLLPLLDKKILLMKDFTVVLDKNKDERKEILGQLRGIYDGYYEKKFGTKATKISYESRFGFIAGVTPVIDRYWKVMQQLGERFLKYRIHLDRKKATAKAYENSGKELRMRAEIQYCVKSFLKGLNLQRKIKFPDEKYKNALVEMADFIATARTPVSGGDEEFEYIPEPELPTRLIKQLKKLAICLARVHKKEEVEDEEIEIVRKVCLDTIPPDRLLVMEVIKKGILPDAEMIADKIGMTQGKTRIILENLERLKLIDIKTRVEGKNRINEYVLTEIAENILRKDEFKIN